MANNTILLGIKSVKGKTTSNLKTKIEGIIYILKPYLKNSMVNNIFTDLFLKMVFQ